MWITGNWRARLAQTNPVDACLPGAAVLLPSFAAQEKTPLTLAEMRRAKEQKSSMLKNSLQSFQFQHGEDD